MTAEANVAEEIQRRLATLSADELEVALIDFQLGEHGEEAKAVAGELVDRARREEKALGAYTALLKAT
jgi:hypothetical protein